jgi:hypothetical protein
LPSTFSSSGTVLLEAVINDDCLVPLPFIRIREQQISNGTALAHHQSTANQIRVVAERSQKALIKINYVEVAGG